MNVIKTPLYSYKGVLLHYGVSVNTPLELIRKRLYGKGIIGTAQADTYGTDE